MKVNDIRALTVEELEAQLLEAQEEQMRRRCNQAILQVNDVSLVRRGRRNIARIQTILNEKRRASVVNAVS